MRCTLRTTLALTVVASLVVALPAAADPVTRELDDTAPPGDAFTTAQDGQTSTEDTGPVRTDDSLYDLQYYLDVTRTSTAWRRTRGNPQVTVAVIDTGLDPNHRDLDGALNVDPASGNFGLDLRTRSGRPYRNRVEDWHGTAIAGIVAARADDGYGMAGVAPEVTILPLKIYRSETDSTAPSISDGYASAIDAIAFAKTRGADVILLTWTGPEPSSELRNAIRDAGVPVVAAAGNDGLDLSASVGPRAYPANDRAPNLITVAASGLEDDVWDEPAIGRSNVGVRHVDIAAPGEIIVAPYAERGHRYHSGTSFAAPQVAGALALALSVAPNEGAASLVAELARTARQVPAFDGQVTSGGILDVEAFLEAVQRPICDDTVPPAPFTDVSRTSVHATSIDCIASFELTAGVGDDRYDPAGQVTRGQMASMLARLLVGAGAIEPLTDPDGDDPAPASFDDLDGNVHAAAIEALAATGIASGFDDGTYRPSEPIDRGQMAALLVRTYGELTEQPLPVPRDWFDDTAGTTHDDAIGVARELGIALGTDDARVYLPGGLINRAQFASQLARALAALAREDIELAG